MSNIAYQAGVAELLSDGKTWDGATWKALLVRSTSTYTPDKDHDLLGADIIDNGLVEISVASYGRITISSPTISKDDGNDRVVIDCGDVSFGNLESGQTVKAIIIYRHVTNDADSIPLLYIDTDPGGLLPRALGGGSFTVVISANGLITIAQA